MRKSGLDLDLYPPHIRLLRLFDACKPSFSVLRRIRSRVSQVDERSLDTIRHQSGKVGRTRRGYHGTLNNEVCLELLISNLCQGDSSVPSLYVNSA